MVIPWSDSEEETLTDQQMIERLVKEADYDQESAQFIVDLLRGRIAEPEGGID